MGSQVLLGVSRRETRGGGTEQERRWETPEKEKVHRVYAGDVGYTGDAGGKQVEERGERTGSLQMIKIWKVLPNPGQCERRYQYSVSKQHQEPHIEHSVA